MKKMIVFALVLTMILCMAVTANAVTPIYTPPKISTPKIDTSAIKVEVPQSFWDKWFAEHPVKISFTNKTLG